MSDANVGRVVCPACLKSYRWKDELAGRKVRCACKAVLVMPDDAPAVDESIPAFHVVEAKQGRAPAAPGHGDGGAATTVATAPVTHAAPAHAPAPHAAVATPGGSVFAPATTLTKAVVALLVASIVFDALNIITELLTVMFFQDMALAGDNWEPTGGEMAFGLSLVCMGLLMIACLMATAAVFLTWMHRSNRNARALGAQAMKFTPGWCVGWWFIPFANLVKPFQAMREIYRASDPETGPDDWQSAEVPSVVGLWWGAWIGGSVLSQMSVRISFNANTSGTLVASSLLGVVGAVASIVAAVLLIQIVRQVTANQLEKAQCLGL